MNKLIVLALLLVGSTIHAQERSGKHQRNEMEQFTPEQKSQLMLKKMTLELDLNEVQQKEVSAIISDNIAKREAHKAEMKAIREKGLKPSKEDHFANRMKMLDEDIATKKRMEKILNPKQFEKWTSMKENNKKHRSNRSQEKRKEKHQ